MKFTLMLCLGFTLLSHASYPQENRIHDLAFLVGNWEVQEDNKENGWWEKSERTIQYALDSTYLQLDAKAISSSGKERVYRWYIHYNSKEEQFEMVSIFSNWHKIQLDILSWEAQTRTLTIQNKANSEEFHERLGQLVFNKDFSTYVWTGENKYGDPKDPSIWKYVEKGTRKEE
ncbi:hypothetical protein [Ekhidna sp.]|uniref:hypothetical protein n=1 Tax=Ekhidna sp. TaxID=2608089 RepID=UPI0032970E3D